MAKGKRSKYRVGPHRGGKPCELKYKGCMGVAVFRCITEWRRNHRGKVDAEHHRERRACMQCAHVWMDRYGVVDSEPLGYIITAVSAPRKGDPHLV